MSSTEDPDWSVYTHWTVAMPVTGRCTRWRLARRGRNADSQEKHSERRDEAGETTMQKSSDNLDNGQADVDDRFGEPLSGEPLSTFRGTVRREVLNSDLDLDGGRRSDLDGRRGDLDGGRRNGSLSGFDGLPGLPPPPSVLDVPGPHIPMSQIPDSRMPEMPMPHMSRLDESVFDPPSWLDSPTMPLADHPLLRGLLLELPAKGPMPTAEWLDRWFEAARSILELLYAQSSR